MTLGELASVAGTQLRADVPEILPLVIDAIQDGGSQTKRLVAVSTLGQVRRRCHWARRRHQPLDSWGGRSPPACSLAHPAAHPTAPQVVGSTGFVVAPYLEYPQLLGVLLRMLSEGTPSARREVMKVRRGGGLSMWRLHRTGHTSGTARP